MKKQIIAKLLVLAMVLAMVPVTVLAASAAGSNLGYSPNYGYYSIGKDTYVVNKPLDGNKIDASTGRVVVNDSIIKSFATLLKDGQMVVELSGDTDSIQFTCSVKALAALAAETGADLVFKTNFAIITFPNELLADLGNAGAVQIIMTKSDKGADVHIFVAGEEIDSSSVKVEPVTAE